MWKPNKVGGYVQTPTKQQRPRSGWAPHPETGETVWYDAKNDTYRDKVGGPARNLLSIGWQLTGGKDAADLVGMTIKGAKRVVPPLYKATKKTIGDAKEVIDDAVTSTKNLAKELLVSKTSPSLTAKDATGITKGKKKVVEEAKTILNNNKGNTDRDTTAKESTPIQTEGISKKKKDELIINKFKDITLE